MLFGLDGVEIGLIIVFLCLFGGILSGFPVAFAMRWPTRSINWASAVPVMTLCWVEICW